MTTLRHRWARAGLAVLLFGSFALPAPASAATEAQTPPAARLEKAACLEMLKRETSSPLDAIFPADISGIECGYVAVPLEHAKPAGPTIKLAVAILRAKAPIPDGDPLVMLQGGPGGGTIETYVTIMSASPLRATRDIVLFDQRGTGKSLPALKCPESIALTRASIEKTQDHETAARLSWEATQACHDRLAREGVNLSAFDSLENAADINSVREALGYARINLYGVSYGTLLALHAMRLEPQILRSVILDSVVPPQTNFVVEATRAENRALTELFGACAADARCAADYPALERVYLAQIDRLSKTPARARMVDPATGAVYNAVIDGDTFRGLIFQALYSTELIPLLPGLIFEVSGDYFGTLGNVASLFAFDQSVASGMYMSVICAEDADFKPADAASADIRPALTRYAAQDAADFQAACQRWNVELLPASIDEPVVSDIPTLVLNGRFDPITPPANGEAAARGLKRATVLTFPNTGHGAFQSEPCASSIAIAFVTTPEVAPSSACVAGLGPPRFIARDELLRVPVFGELLTAPGRDRNAESTALGIALLLVLSSLLLLPLGWLARTVLKKHHPSLKPPLLATLMPWAVALNAVLLLGFLTGFLIAPIFDLAGGAYTFLVGLGSDYRPLFALPWISLALTAFTAAGAAAGIASPAWGVLRKLYRVALALASLIAVVVLAIWGTLGVLFAR
ncbi:MAG: alpha/beta fold hydrolase [Thermoflexales bacterium]|nr:alpha/beta fold hydrolase [Thermoflexales bacterium]